MVRLLVSERSTITAYATSLVYDHDLAEEIYQDVVVVVLRKRDRVADVDDALAWVLGVTRVEALVAARKRSKRAQTFPEPILDLIDESWSERIRSREDQEARSEALRKCLRKLSARQMSILRLRYGDGLSGEKLAEALGIKLNTAYVTLSRIHKSLRDCISAAESRSSVS